MSTGKPGPKPIPPPEPPKAPKPKTTPIARSQASTPPAPVPPPAPAPTRTKPDTEIEIPVVRAMPMVPANRPRWIAAAALLAALAVGGVFVMRRPDAEAPAVAEDQKRDSTPVIVFQPGGRRADKAKGPQRNAVQPTVDKPPPLKEPGLKERFELLYKLLVAYLDSHSRPQAYKGLSLGMLDEREEFPDEVKLKRWFRGLTHQQRLTIDARFGDRERWLAQWRDIQAGKVSPKDVDSDSNTTADLFDRPENVFISPNDGLPFRIGHDVIWAKCDLNTNIYTEIPMIGNLPENIMLRDVNFRSYAEVIVLERRGITLKNYQLGEDKVERHGMKINGFDILIKGPVQQREAQRIRPLGVP